VSVPVKSDRHWVLADHLCSGCGGRILKCVKGGGMTPGGNPVWKCAQCGNTKADMVPPCWCQMTMRMNEHDRPYRCFPFSVLAEFPKLEHGFRACGCDPARGEVGIMTFADYNRLMRSDP